MDSFYTQTVRKLLRRGLLALEMRVLVVCGGILDKETLAGLGFQSVTISNLDVRMKGDEYAPFAWSFQDAENIGFQDDEFDFCIVHNGLHHCHSPHRALLELYRVAKTGLLVFEPRDNLATRLGVLLNFGQDYEVAAVYGNACAFGGVKNTEVPNYVYRWTEREIVKAVSSYAPWGRHRFLFFHTMRVPWQRLRGLKNKSFLILLLLAFPFLKFFFWLFPRQSNNFAFAIFKPQLPGDLHPWIEQRSNRFMINKAWLEQRYR